MSSSRRSHEHASGAVKDAAQDDYSIFPAIDGVKETPPWRIRDYHGKGAISQADVDALGAEYALPRSVVAQLAVELGNSLDIGSAMNLTEVKSSKAIKLADEALRRAQRHANKSGASQHLRTAILELDNTFAASPEDAALLDKAKQAAKEPASTFEELQQAARSLLDAPGSAVLMRPRDKRAWKDIRRIWVVWSCCHAWCDAGRSPTYTTVPDGSKHGLRHGPLVDLIQEVTALVTEPPSQLNGETIRKDIDAFKAKLSAPDPLLEEPEFGRS